MRRKAMRKVTRRKKFRSAGDKRWNTMMEEFRREDNMRGNIMRKEFHNTDDQCNMRRTVGRSQHIVLEVFRRRKRGLKLRLANTFLQLHLQAKNQKGKLGCTNCGGQLLYIIRIML
ncbi:hypothetical protein LWI28_007818 [Acer negundo]|uniref:Uncharacterized protein n=1 Tax=Acer negundo TaxID=4023 RepID=A0AAD5P4Z4_ACENE|nr:hypothetical protein LWI28_007818 [Acer negundo]